MTLTPEEALSRVRALSEGAAARSVSLSTGPCVPIVVRENAPEPATAAPAPIARRHSYDWTDVDWSLTDKQIALQRGCTAPAVAYQRKKRTGHGNWIEDAILEKRIALWIDRLPTGAMFTEEDVHNALLHMLVADAVYDLLELGAVRLVGWQDNEPIVEKVTQAPDPLVWDSTRVTTQ